jgi:hypothetical protein
MQNKAESADYYRSSATELRIIAVGIYDPHEREQLMQLADDLEQLPRVIKVKIAPPARAARPRAQPICDGTWLRDKV